MADNASGLSGAERAAILLLSLGEQDAAALIRHMDAREVQRVGEAMAALKDVPRDRVQSVLGHFVQKVETQGPGGAGTADYVRRVLTTSLGKQRAEMLLDRIDGGAPASAAGIDQLKWMAPRQVAQLIGEEHPQVIAILLAHLDPELGGAAIELLPEEIRADVLMRVATLDEVPQTALTELDSIVERRAAQGTPATAKRLGGAKLAAGMLNAMGKDRQADALTRIETADSELFQTIKERMFVFEDLLKINDKGIQAILREVPSDQLATALRAADPEVQDKIFRNMSKRAAEILRDDMEARGPVKLSEVEAAQKEVVAVAQRLAEEGTILLGGGAGEYV